MSSLPPTTERTKNTPVRLRAPLVGRSAELALLEDALTDTLEKRAPHTITLMGGPGVGKSRLCREFLADVRARHEHVRVLTGHCREGGDPFGVVRSILRARLNIADGLDGPSAEQALRQTVSEVMGDRRVGELVHFLGAFLDLSLTGSALAQAMSSDPEQVRQVARSVLRHFLEADAAKQALVIMLEDFQLAHADAVSLMHYLVGAITRVPILFVIVARPELLSRHPQWLELGGDAIRFDLAPLQPDDSAEMVEQLLAPLGEIPTELIDEAVELASGNPYLIEQIVRTYFAQSVIVPRSSTLWEADVSRLQRVQLPLSVDDAIHARIAALAPEEKSLLEMAAALGGVFWLGTLVAMDRSAGAAPRLWSDAKSDRARLRHLLDELIERDYVMRLPDSSVASDVEYAFKHNLEREALHSYTSRQLLVRYHQVIAQWLELRLRENSEEHHELLAQHYEKGGVATRAAQHYLLAGERARNRYASARAAGYYGHGLALLGDGEGMLRVRSLGHWGEALELSGDSDLALVAFEQMRVLSYQLDLAGQAALAHASIGRIHHDRQALPLALEHFDAAYALYEHEADRNGSAATLEAMATIHAARGQLEAAHHMIRDAIATCEQTGNRLQLAAALRSYAILAARLPERVDAAALFERSLQLFEELGNEVELSRTALVFADQLEATAAAAPGGSGGSEPRRKAERLRQRARELLERQKGLSIRASLVPEKA